VRATPCLNLSTCACTEPYRSRHTPDERVTRRITHSLQRALEPINDANQVTLVAARSARAHHPRDGPAPRRRRASAGGEANSLQCDAVVVAVVVFSRANSLSGGVCCCATLTLHTQHLNLPFRRRRPQRRERLEPRHSTAAAAAQQAAAAQRRRRRQQHLQSRSSAGVEWSGVGSRSGCGFKEECEAAQQRSSAAAQQRSSAAAQQQRGSRRQVQWQRRERAAWRGDSGLTPGSNTSAACAAHATVKC
jgi:hypothetical protein